MLKRFKPNMTLRPFLLLCACAAILSGCDNGGGFMSKYPEPAMLEAKRFSLRGNDDNRDGVRDEIEMVIKGRFPSSPEDQGRLWLYAKTWHSALEVTPDMTPSLIAGHALNVSNAMACALKATTYQREVNDAIKDIHAVMFDSPERKAAMLKFSELTRGMPIFAATDPCKALGDAAQAALNPPQGPIQQRLDAVPVPAMANGQ